MKNEILMMSKIQSGGGTLLTSICVFSVLGILLLLILNRNHKLKCLKKMTSVALILTMLLLPFSNLLNVKAEGTVTEIKIDDNKKVINTTDIVVSDIMGNEETLDEFTAFKILDVYYDKDTNEMSYKFTTLFENYKNSSYAQVTWYSNEYDLSGLTIDEYFNNDNGNKFAALVDSFSKYIKSDKTITGIDLVSSNNEAKATGVEVGSYLVLPSNLVSHESASLFGNLVRNAYSIYDALIANAVFEVSNNNWTLEPCNVSSKGYGEEAAYEGFILKTKVSELINYLNSLMEGDDDTIPQTLIYNKELQRETDYTYWAIPFYYNDFQNRDIWSVEITFPDGIDYNDIYFSEGKSLVPIADGKIYNDSGNEIASISEDKSENKITITNPWEKANDSMGIAIGMKINDKIALGLNANQIKVTYKFGANKYDPTSQQTLTFENNITTYGVQVTNKSNSNDSLSGSTFGLYTDEECTNKLGEFTTDSNGVASIKGVITGNYYIKQIKATSGYKLNSNVFTANITSENLTDGYYLLEVTNEKTGLLPSTGGLGTIFYTLIGLMIIGLGGYEVVKYSKKQVNS